MITSEKHSKRILIIDDNPAIHADIRKILCPPQLEPDELSQAKSALFGPEEVEPEARLTFQIDSAYQGEEGLRMVQSAMDQADPYAVAFVDIRMPPGWDGVETIVHLWKSYPDLQVVVCTAYSDYSWEAMVQKLGPSRSFVVLKKPFDNIEVLQLAHALADKWQLNRQVQAQLCNLDALVTRRTSELEHANEKLKLEIAARIEAEGVMRLSEDRFSKAFRATPIPLAIQSLETDRLVDVNDAFLRMLGGSREQIVDRSPMELKLWIDPGLPRTVFENLLQRPSFHNHPCQVRTLEGQERHVLLSIETFESGAGTHLLVILQDLTDQLKLEGELRQMQKMEAVGQLAAGVAHDFNNILTVIHGHTSLLQLQLGQDSASGKQLKVISLAAERATRLVRQLLTFSRKQTLKPQLLHLDQVAAHLTEMLHGILGKHITLDVQSEPGLPAIKADLGMMEQIILNLAVNARDAMPRGGSLTLQTGTTDLTASEAGRHADCKPGRYVVLQLSDTGTGIAPEHLSRIFDPFFTTKEVGKGTGLGLATVYGIVKQHNGAITVDSVLQGGTTFRVLLPVSTESSPASKAPGAPPPGGVRGSECILVVEDEDLVRSMTTSLLQTKGYRILEAGSGQAALTLFKAHSDEINLLFTDIVMPGNMLGDELATRAREIKASVPVLFTSGYTPDMITLHRVQDSEFLPKPFTPAQLLERVRHCLDAAAARHEGKTNICPSR